MKEDEAKWYRRFSVLHKKEDTVLFYSAAATSKAILPLILPEIKLL